ncbi:unnamed protein product [Chilo suppressalis]|uniref:Mitochondrial transcription rescue factor 1 C-terminal domain-containing protein n=1 Tax=Chilo suppressalis TaxID=168631 RepID=A0ABN8B1G8_CHISP|nr:hypothetical protein evm_001705 [Chilo suppressalis]CAH0399203.1 unnamed protein product [Chilo suppressalis]
MNTLWRRSTASLFLYRNLKPVFFKTPRLHHILCENFDLTSKHNLPSSSSFIFSRLKSKKQIDSDDEDNFNDDTSLSKDSKVVKFNTTSMRTDVILKSALGVARNKIEQVFYESKIRLNGKKILKKSASTKVGDEIDVIKAVSPKNTDHLIVSRVEILNITANEDAITVTARRFKSLLIENYEKDAYKSSVDSEADK